MEILHLSFNLVLVLNIEYVSKINFQKKDNQPICWLLVSLCLVSVSWRLAVMVMVY